MMRILQPPARVRPRGSITVTAARIKTALLIIFFATSLSLLVYTNHLHQLLSSPPPPQSQSPPAQPLPIPHVLFSIASSSASLPSRAPYIRLWHAPISHLNTTFLFLNTDPPPLTAAGLLPQIVVQNASSSYPAAKRIAHIVKDAFGLDVPGIHWYVFGDDDTVFFPENVAKVLSKYDHGEWHYVGGPGSESYDQNHKFYFDMAFGGGGYAISAPLVRALSAVMDDCLDRYGHLFGSDVMVYSCLAELGVPLTVERGFHQMDLRGDALGLLSAHPLSPIASLHHFDAIEPIFPNMSRTRAIEHLFRAARLDQGRILQQTVCYDSNNTLTYSISWGHSVQVYEGNHLLPDLASPQRTFKPWKRGKNAESSARFMFKTRGFPRDSCRRPLTFYMSDVVSDSNGVRTEYVRNGSDDGECSRSNGVDGMKIISVLSPRPEFDFEKVKTLRRQCCDVWPSHGKETIVRIRKCHVDELIAMKKG